MLNQNQNEYRIDHIKNIPKGNYPALFGSVYRIDSSQQPEYQYGLGNHQRMQAEHPMLWGRIRSEYNYPSLDIAINPNANNVQNNLNIPPEYMANNTGHEEFKDQDYTSRLKKSLEICKNKTHIFLGCKLLIGHIMCSYIKIESAERRIFPLKKEDHIFENEEEKEPSYFITPEGEFYYFNAITQAIERFDFNEDELNFEYVGDIPVICGPLYSPVFYLLSQLTSDLVDKKILLLIGGSAGNGSTSELIHLYDLKDLDSYKGPIKMNTGRGRPLVFHDNLNLYILGGAQNNAMNKIAEQIPIKSLLNLNFGDISCSKFDVNFSNFSIKISSLENAAMTLNSSTNKWIILRKKKREILEVRNIDTSNKTINIGYFKKKLNCPVHWNLGNTNTVFLSPFILLMTDEKPYILKTKISSE